MDTGRISELQDIISGVVATAGDEVYQKASKMFVCTINPGVVVQPQNAKDVAQTVLFAKKYDMPFAIRSGGHNSVAARLADGILLIDMSAMASIEIVDEKEGLVRIGAGALWHKVATALEKHNLGLSSGDTRTVGVGGLATGAGIGWMVREYGLVLDSTVSMEVVTADGRILQASKDENPDLFWAVRGGGSNFGIVTHFTFMAHPVGSVYLGHITYLQVNVGDVIKGWRDAMRDAPAELTTILTAVPARGEDSPASIMITGCFAGTDKEAAEKAYAPLLGLGGTKPLSQDISAKPYSAMLEDGKLPPGVRVVVHNTFIKELSDDAITAIDTLLADGSPILQIRHIGGAMNKVPVDESAFAFRNSEVLIVNPTLVMPDASDEDVANATAAWQTIASFGQGLYLNLTTEDTGKEVFEAYPPSVMERLKEIKAKYDPDNIFTSSYNIQPAQ